MGCPAVHLFEEGYFALENAEFRLGDVDMISPEGPGSGFYLRHLPAEQAKLIGLSRINHVGSL